MEFTLFAMKSIKHDKYSIGVYCKPICGCGFICRIIGVHSEIDRSLVQHIGDDPDSMPTGSLSYLLQSQLQTSSIHLKH